jgi:hypothetical protein
MPAAITLFRPARSDDRFAQAYLVSATILRTLDRLELTTDGRGLVFKRVSLYDQRFLACEIETSDLAESLAKDLRKYRQVVALTHVLGLPVKTLVRQNSVTFAIDLGRPVPISWRTRVRLFLQKSKMDRSS